jgi:hypothetical protein
MKKTYRILTLLLVLVIAAGSVLSCAGAEPGSNTDVTTADTTVNPEEELTEIEKRQLVSDGIPDGLDFGGEEFMMLVATEHLYDAWIEEMSGDIVEDSVYERNAAIAERFNITIPEATNSDYGTISTYLRNAINSGDDVYDLYLGHAVQSGADALNDWFLNWYDINYMNFEQPWYPQHAIKELTINGRMFLSVSDMAISATENTYCMFFDKVHAESYNMGNIYDLVNTGKWTVDKLISLTKGIYTDLDGNGKVDENDFFGFTSNCYSNSNTYLWAFDQPVVEVTPELEINITYNSEKTIAIIDKVRELYFQEGSIVFEDHFKGYDTFRTGHAIFVNGFIGHSVTYYRDFEHDYGIIPYPKWNEEQAAYYSMADGNFSIIAAPVTVSNTDMLGAVVHALGAYSWKNVIPNYYDIALKVKGTRDEESVAILDMILDSRVIDFAYLYDAWKGYVFTFQEFTYKNNKKEFSSMFESKLKAATKSYEDVLALFLD